MFCSGWSSHPVVLRNSFDRIRRHIIQMKVICLRATPEEGKVGLIPNFKVPMLHFLLSITFCPMLNQRFDQVAPLVIVFWRSNIALPPKNCSVPAGQRFWHEPKFYKRPDANAHQKIVELINILPIVNRVGFPVLKVNTHIVVQQPVHADVTKTCLLFYITQLSLPVSTQTFIRSSCAHTLIEKFIQLAFDSRHVNGNGPVIRLRLKKTNQNCETYSEK